MTATLATPQDRRDDRGRAQPRTACPGAPRPALDLQRRLVARLVG